MKITLVQNNIEWEHKSSNLIYYESLLSGLAGKTDLAVLPEMCTTGFSMNSPSLAEYDDEETVNFFKRMAASYDFAITGSFIGKGKRSEGNGTACYNRGFFITPDGKSEFYNKRHLFRIGEENGNYEPGSEKPVFKYKGWNIRLIICYDLRFPVWNRNVENEYDLLIVVANWPESRQEVWKSLLTARAIENMAYVCGVNRVGIDGMGMHYLGESQLINAYGSILTSLDQDVEQIQTLDIDLGSLNKFREKFPVWKDADKFQII